jgi:hypothetical protein
METPNLDVQQKHCREEFEYQLPTVEEIMDTYNLDDPKVATEIRRWKGRRIRWPWAFEGELVASKRCGLRSPQHRH